MACGKSEEDKIIDSMIGSYYLLVPENPGDTPVEFSFMDAAELGDVPYRLYYAKYWAAINGMATFYGYVSFDTRSGEMFLTSFDDGDTQSYSYIVSSDGSLLFFVSDDGEKYIHKYSTYYDESTKREYQEMYDRELKRRGLK